MESRGLTRYFNVVLIIIMYYRLPSQKKGSTDPDFYDNDDFDNADNYNYDDDNIHHNHRHNHNYGYYYGEEERYWISF